MRANEQMDKGLSTYIWILGCSEPKCNDHLSLPLPKFKPSAHCRKKNNYASINTLPWLDANALCIVFVVVKLRWRKGSVHLHREIDNRQNVLESSTSHVPRGGATLVSYRRHKNGARKRQRHPSRAAKPALDGINNRKLETSVISALSVFWAKIELKRQM